MGRKEMSYQETMAYAILAIIISMNLGHCVKIEANSLQVNKCCPADSSFDLQSKKCLKTSQRLTFEDIPVDVFSTEVSDYVDVNVSVSNFSQPKCRAGEKLTHLIWIKDTGQEFAIVAEEAELFVSRDSSTRSEYCLDFLQDKNEEVGTVAMYCGPDPETLCGELAATQHNRVCVSSCCPQGTIFNKATGDCEVDERGNELEIRFYHQQENKTIKEETKDFMVFYQEPNCSYVQLYKGDNRSLPAELTLGLDGFLHVGQNKYTHSQYCLQTTVTQDEEFLYEAKVCDQTPEQDLVKHDLLASKIVPAFLVLSEIFLFITISLHVLVPDLRKPIFGWMKLSTVVCLFLSYQWLLIIQLGGQLLLEHHNNICQALGFFLQYSFLCAFCWMSAMAAEVWTTFRRLRGSADDDIRYRFQLRRFIRYNIFAWGLPFLITTITVIIHVLPESVTQSAPSLIVPDIGAQSCFFSGYMAKILYFHGIIAVILIVNLFFFLWSAWSLLFGIWAPTSDDNIGKKSRQMLWVVLELFLVMGLTWIAEVVSFGINWYYNYQYLGWEIILFDSINSLQGVFIFVVLICKPRMRNIIQEKLSTSLANAFNCSKPVVHQVDSPKSLGTQPRSLTATTFTMDKSVPSTNTHLSFSSSQIHRNTHRMLFTRGDEPVMPLSFRKLKGDVSEV